MKQKITRKIANRKTLIKPTYKKETHRGGCSSCLGVLSAPAAAVAAADAAVAAAAAAPRTGRMIEQAGRTGFVDNKKPSDG